MKQIEKKITMNTKIMKNKLNMIKNIFNKFIEMLYKKALIMI